MHEKVADPLLFEAADALHLLRGDAVGVRPCPIALALIDQERRGCRVARVQRKVQRRVAEAIRRAGSQSRQQNRRYALDTGLGVRRAILARRRGQEHADHGVAARGRGAVSAGQQASAPQQRTVAADSRRPSHSHRHPPRAGGAQCRRGSCCSRNAGKKSCAGSSRAGPHP